LQAPFSSTVTFTVTVASKTAAHRYSGSGSSNGYKIDGIEAPFITLTPGRTYKFDQADSSNSGHPLRFYLEANKTTAFTTGVTTNGTAGSSGAYTEITVTDTTPQILHYQCSAHGFMGNSVQANSNIASYSLADNAKATFGADDDLQIFHDSSNTHEVIAGNNLYLRTKANNQTHAFFLEDGKAALNFGNNTKFETSNTGATVTGTLVADAFTGPLTGNVTGNASGSAATVTGAAQSAITSVGTLTSLGVTGNLTVDTDTLHVDATNNRCGIGTTSPSSLLNLKRTSTTGYSTSSTTNDTSLLVQNIGAAGHSTIQLDVKSGGTANIGQATISAFPENNSSKATALSFGTRDNSGNQATERMRIDSSGKVGIGTTAPAKLLTVDAASGDGELQVSGSTGGRINLKDTGSGEEFLIACAGDAHIQALTGGKSIVLKTTPSGGSVTTALTLDSSQNATFAGNISVNGGSNTTQATFTGTASRGLKISTANQTSPGTMADASVIYDAQTLISGTLYGEHQFQTGGTTRVTINRFGNLIGTGTISDSKGDLRSIVQNHKTGAYTLIASDAGKMITITTGGVTVNNSIFSAGQAVSIINHSGSDQTITQGSSFTLHNTADATTGNRTLAGRGMATMWFSSHNEAYISGAGLS